MNLTEEMKMILLDKQHYYNKISNICFDILNDIDMLDACMNNGIELNIFKNFIFNEKKKENDLTPEQRIYSDIFSDFLAETILIMPDDTAETLEYVFDFFLDEIEHEVIKKYYYEKQTLSQISSYKNCSHQRISQIYHRALQKLKQWESKKMLLYGKNRNTVLSTMTVEQMNLSNRAYNLLKRNGYNYVVDIWNLKFEDLKSLKSCGIKIAEIIDKLEKIKTLL